MKTIFLVIQERKKTLLRKRKKLSDVLSLQSKEVARQKALSRETEKVMREKESDKRAYEEEEEEVREMICYLFESSPSMRIAHHPRRFH